MAGYKELSPAQAQQLMAGGDPIILDARDAHSYRAEHIEGALLAHDGLTESLIKKRDFSRPVLVYCYHGNTSKDLARLLSGIGFRDVHNLTGGYTAWKKIFSSAS